MNFLERLKSNLNDVRRRAGLEHGRALVDASALHELIAHYERMDSEDRVLHNRGLVSVEQALFEAITAVYHKQGKSSEKTMEIIMETLLPLIKERHKAIGVMQYFGSGRKD